MKKTKKDKRKLYISALLSTLFLIISATLLIYSYIKTWSPFSKVYAQTSSINGVITVRFETKVPVKAFVEYGTSQIYLNKTETTNEYKKTHRIPVANVLPERKHFVRIIAQTTQGKEYTTDFLIVD